MVAQYSAGGRRESVGAVGRVPPSLIDPVLAERGPGQGWGYVSEWGILVGGCARRCQERAGPNRSTHRSGADEVEVSSLPPTPSTSWLRRSVPARRCKSICVAPFSLDPESPGLEGGAPIPASGALSLSHDSNAPWSLRSPSSALPPNSTETPVLPPPSRIATSHTPSPGLPIEQVQPTMPGLNARPDLCTQDRRNQLAGNPRVWVAPHQLNGPTSLLCWDSLEIGKVFSHPTGRTVHLSQRSLGMSTSFVPPAPRGLCPSRSAR